MSRSGKTARRIAALQRRADVLDERLERWAHGNPDRTKAELAAIEWAIEMLSPMTTGTSPYRAAGFDNRITFDIYECLRDRYEMADEDNERLRAWMIDREQYLWDGWIGNAIDQIGSRAYEQRVLPRDDS